MKSRAARIVVGLLGMTGSFVAGLFVAEMGLRILPRRGGPAPSAMVEAPMSAPVTRADRRERGPVGPKPEGRSRILVVGDSFTWGAGVHAEDAYPDRLDAWIGGQDGAYEVVNWSRPGWNTVQELAALEEHVDTLAPDVVVLGFCLNDAEPLSRRARDELRKPLFRRAPDDGLPAGLYERSALFHLVWERLENSRQRRAFRRYFHRLYEPDAPGFEAAVEALEGLRDLARDRGISFLLVVFPIFDSQLGPTYGYRDLHDRLVAVGGEVGIPVLDLLPSFDGIDGRRLAAEPFTDSHPSELGHRIAAEVILDRLRADETIRGETPLETLQRELGRTGRQGERIAGARLPD